MELCPAGCLYYNSLHEIEKATIVVITDKGKELQAARDIRIHEIVAIFGDSMVLSDHALVNDLRLMVNKHNKSCIPEEILNVPTLAQSLVGHAIKPGHILMTPSLTQGYIQFTTTLPLRKNTQTTKAEDSLSCMDTQTQLTRTLSGRELLAEEIDFIMLQWASLDVSAPEPNVPGERATAKLLEADITDY